MRALLSSVEGLLVCLYIYIYIIKYIHTKIYIHMSKPCSPFPKKCQLRIACIIPSFQLRLDLQFLFSVVHDEIGHIDVRPIRVGGIIHRAAAEGASTQTHDAVGIGSEASHRSHLPVGTCQSQTTRASLSLISGCFCRK